MDDAMSPVNGAGGYDEHEDGKPSIKKAWQFGRETRPHRIPDPTQPSGYRLARIGEIQDEKTGAKAEEYNYCTTWLSGFDEFGIGISLYFRQLIFLSVIFLLAGIGYIPTLYHNYKTHTADTPSDLRGSSFGATRSELLFTYNGIVDFVVCLFLLLFALVSKRVEDLAAETIDISQQTTQDYAVMVHNPPPHVKDPDVYHRFFSKYGEVVFVSVALNNGEVLRLLKRKRELRPVLRKDTACNGKAYLDAEATGRDMPDLEQVGCFSRLLHCVGLVKNKRVLVDDYVKINERLQALSQKNYSVKRVYVVFNTEQAKRECIKDLQAGVMSRLFGAMDVSDVWERDGGPFEGRVLKVIEPVEPSEVLWHNFDYKRWERAIRAIFSLFLAALMLVLSYLLLNAARYQSGAASAIIVSAINVALPIFMKTVVASVERHVDQSDMQDSIMFKLVTARCLNTAVIKYLVTDYTATFDKVTLSSIMSILIADCITTPVLGVLNIPGRIKRWFVAPLAKTQREMDLYFVGDEWNLSERYTDMIKTVFLALFYSAIVPSSVFITSAAMFSIYCADKYNLLYQWKRPPALDSTLASRSRNFLTVSICVHVIISRIFFANWPYETEADKSQCGFFACYTPDGAVWTNEQKTLVALYTVFGWVVMGIVGWTYLSSLIMEIFAACTGHVEEVGQASNIAFRHVQSAEAYIPLIRSSIFPDAFLAADVSTVPTSFIPVRTIVDGKKRDITHLVLNSHKDLPFIKDPNVRSSMFSTVKFYPEPAGQSSFGMAIDASALGASAAVVANPAALNPDAYTVHVPGLQGAINVAANILQPGQLQQPTVLQTGMAQPPLPPGWDELLTPDGNGTYYYHRASNTTQWDRPRAAGPGTPDL